MMSIQKTGFLLLVLSLAYLNADVWFSIQKTVDSLGAYYYPLDDSYIHLAISKNIAQHGVWGITPHEFSNSSSSPLFSLILAAAIKVFGNHSETSLYLNWALANLLLVAIYFFFKQKPWQMLVAYFAFCVSAMLKTHVLSGMEHTLQLLVTGLAWMSFCQWQALGFGKSKLQYLFYATITLSCVSRYESMFFIAPIFLYLLYYKHYSKAITSLTLAFLPIIFFGLYALSKGSHFFPNSLLVKGKHHFYLASILEMLSDFWGNIQLIHIPFIVLFSLLSYLGFSKNKGLVILHGIVICNFILHFMFATAGFQYRYDAYLMAFLSLSSSYLWFEMKFETPWSKNMVIVLLMILMPLLIYRERKADTIFHFGRKNIYDQQIQMGRFVQKYYPSARVMANDIGAICYMSHLHLHDLIGLGSNQIVGLKISSKPKQAIENYVKNTPYDLMMIYDSWFQGSYFGGYKVAELSITCNKVCGDDKVSFYVQILEQKAYAIKSLHEFKRSLPKDVNLEIMP